MKYRSQIKTDNMSRLKRKGEKMVKTARQLAELGGIKGDGSRKHKRKLKKYQKVTQQHSAETANAYSKLTPQEKYTITSKAPTKMESNKQKRIKKRLDRRQSKVDESRATFGTNDPHLGKFDRRLNRLKRTVNQAEKQGMNVNYDTRNASGEGAVKTTTVKSSINMNYSPNKMGHSPAEMESAKQEKYNLLHDNPVAKHGSWMSKHSKSAFQMGHSPAEMGHDSPAKKEGEKPKTKKELAAESRARGRESFMKAQVKKDKKSGAHTGKMVKVMTSKGIQEVDSRSQAARDLPRA